MPDKVIDGALERWKYSEAGSSHIREWALADIDFGRLANQWPDDVRRTRMAEGRPCLTVNRLPSFIRQVVNDGRQNKPSINVIPVDNGADMETAEIIGGLIRSIERSSNAPIAYDTALEHAVSCGFGFFRITTDYCHSESFDQEAKIQRVANPFSVHWDVDSTAFDASDWNYAFVSDLLTPAEFKARYPKAKAQQEWQEGQGEGLEDWSGEDRIRVAEYWLREEQKRKIVRMSDGSVLKLDELREPVALPDGSTMPLIDALALGGITVNGERESSFYKVARRVINAVEVLEESEWPGSLIPICPVWGEEVNYRGRRYFRSLIRDARDPQSMMNFWRTASTELVALAPRAPFLVPVGGIPAGSEQKWLSANTRSHAFLEYDPSAGPMPQRQAFAGVPAGALQEALNAADDIKSVIGIYDASLGARSNETSGRAILARQSQGITATFHFLDNLARAIEYAGRVLIDIIPSVYSARQAIRVLGENDHPKIVRLMSSQGEMPTPEDPDGKLYDLAAGKYDVTVTVGPNYETQRQETFQNLTTIITAQPQAATVLGDMILENMDFPGAKDAAFRVRVIQVLEGVKAGIPLPVLADMFPDVAQKFGPMLAQQQAPQGASMMPPDMAGMPMQPGPAMGATPPAGGI